MAKEIFISYSRRDQEFVTRLASDLNAQVAGVWFDQSAIQLGQKWQDEIMEGIRDCKAFILVLSPDAMESRYVREEVNKALELGKTIFPVIYRPANWTGEFASLVKDVQTLDLRSGSYTNNFHRLVDGLLETGAGKISAPRPFLRQPTKPGMDVVLSKIPGWAFAWSAGWLVFWTILFTLLAIALIVYLDPGESAPPVTSTENAGFMELVLFVVVLLAGVGIGGFAGGLLAGLFTMLTLRAHAPSISWRHMSPAIRIWGFTGPLGIIASGLLTALMVGIGAISVQNTEANCDDLSFGQCFFAGILNDLGEAIALLIIIVLVFLLLVMLAWFLTGMFAGWQAVRHIRRLEPGITRGQSWRVSAGWGCGAILAAVVMTFLIGVLSSSLGL